MSCRVSDSGYYNLRALRLKAIDLILSRKPESLVHVASNNIDYNKTKRTFYPQNHVFRTEPQNMCMCRYCKKKSKKKRV